MIMKDHREINMYSVQRKIELSSSDYRSWVLFIPVFVAILIITGCDHNREEKEALKLQISQQQQQLERLKENQQQLVIEVSKHELEIAEQQLALTSLQQTQDKEEAELLEYLGKHKLATAALISTGSVAAITKSDDIKNLGDDNAGEGSGNVAIAAGIVGTGYCLIKVNECGEVVARYAAYNEATKNIDTKIVTVETNITQLQLSKDALIMQVSNLDPRIKKLEIDVSDLKQQLADLQDKSWF